MEDIFNLLYIYITVTTTRYLCLSLQFLHLLEDLGLQVLFGRSMSLRSSGKFDSRSRRQEVTKAYSQDGREEKPEKPIGRAPKARVCYICGRQYMLHSFAIHEPQCIKLFEDREALKPKKDRKPVPVNPAKAMGSQNTMKESMMLRSGFTEKNEFTLDELNAASQSSYSSATLTTCKWCKRTFLPEKILPHQKMCTKDKPMRRVGEGIGSRLALPTTGAEAGYRGIEKQRQRQPKLEMKFVPKATTSTIRMHATADSGTMKTHTQTDWRSKSNAFRTAMAYARKVSQAEAKAKATGEHIDTFLALPSEEERQLMAQSGGGGGGLVPCPHCSREFSEKSAERHIPKCQSIQSKPTRLLRGTGKGIGSATHSPVRESSVRERTQPMRGQQGSAFVSNDSGVALFERKRVGIQQRIHPSLSQDQQRPFLNSDPYGPSLTMPMTNSAYGRKGRK